MAVIEATSLGDSVWLEQTETLTVPLYLPLPLALALTACTGSDSDHFCSYVFVQNKSHGPTNPHVEEEAQAYRSTGMFETRT